MDETPRGNALKYALDSLQAVNIPGAQEKNTFSYAELHELKDEEQLFLIPELLPSHAVCGFIGEDGIGKTQLCIQLCLHIAMKRRTFLGLPLNPVHNRCLMVATEDSRQRFTKAIIKQAYALNPAHNPKDVLIDFTEGGNFDEIATLHAEIIKLLKLNSYDLIVVDAFSDLFGLIDGEINNSGHARKLIGILQQICNVYKTTVIFVHHAAKTKIVQKKKDGKIFLEKDDSQGAGAITQKPRTVWGLTHDKKSINSDGTVYTNYLHVVKANLMSKLYVTQAIQLQYDTSVLLHTDTGMVDIEMMDLESQENNPDLSAPNARKPHAEEISYDDHLSYVNSAFKDNDHLSRADLVGKLQKIYPGNLGQNKFNARGGYIECLINNGIIINFQGKFRKAKSDQGALMTEEEAPF